MWAKGGICNMAIRKKRKTRASRHWKLHLLSGFWGILVVGLLIAVIVKRHCLKQEGIAINERLLKEICAPKLPAGIPDEEVDFIGFTVHFNSAHHVPNYVVYTLTRDHIGGKATYNGTFYNDDSVDGCAMPLEYAKSGYQRGHMAPAADMKWNAVALEGSYAMLNICPQRRQLNTGSWRKLEEKVREWGQRDSMLVVITGPVLTKQMSTIGNANKIAVPEHFFKVVFAPHAHPTRAIAFVMPNENADKHYAQYAVSIDEVERLTGIDFFHTLPEAEQSRLESTSDTAPWFHF